MIANVPDAWNEERWSENVGLGVSSVAYSADGRLFAAGTVAIIGSSEEKEPWTISQSGEQLGSHDRADRYK